ncbi:MAG: TauD/TfdA dioxygenase family protein [Alphaproteobacteria bacterium]
MALDIAPIDGKFAYEVRGLQLWQPLTPDLAEQIARIWSTQGVLVFRRQALSEAELVAFSRHFGTPHVIVRTDWQSRNEPEVLHISNMRNQAGDPIGAAGSGELDWHTDQSYVLDPATGSILYMVEMPKDGGATYWANLQDAYDALPAAMRDRIEGLHAVYDYLKRQSTFDQEKPMSAELRAKTPPVVHPLVTRHPVTGRKALYLDPTTSTGILEMPGAGGDRLLAELNAHATRPDFVYRHDWQIGDVVMWDNGLLLHRRDPFDSSQNRLLKRTTLKLSPQRHIVPQVALHKAA